MALTEEPDAFDRNERVDPLRVHCGLEHLGAFVGGASTWTACRDVAPPATSTGTISGLAGVFLAAAAIDDLDLDGLARRLRSIGVTDVAGSVSQPKGDGFFGFVLVVAELHGCVDVGRATLDQYRHAAELLCFVAVWAEETAADEAAQLEATTDGRRQRAPSVAESHRVPGGPARPPPAPVLIPSHHRQRAMAGS